MGKKSKTGKKRLDKYYYLAKEHGFRSRAAFKLIQLNKKYHFLQSSTVLIDLCAAPGGWCQVASKEMPVSSIKIGIDLDPIKPIPGVTTFQCDITSEQCRHLIKKEIKHLKADVVLHDGAPNVGGQWSKDSYGQSELVLFAIKLATEFLKEGGWFISKVFRSSDYNSLIYVMRKLFSNVEATKPLASRSQAAEIFVVCSGYRNPSFIDSKLLDPKFALKQIESENEMKSNSLRSIRSVFEQKKNRGGYNSDSLFIVKNFKNFIECDNPYEFLTKTNKIKVDSDDCNKYLNEVKPKFDYKMYFDDIQILGKQEFKELIVWRNKIRSKLHFERNEKKNEENKEEKKEKTMDELMDEELEKYKKSRLAKQIKDRKKQEKILLKNKQAFIEQEENALDNDVEVDDKLFEYIQKNKINIEELENVNQEKEKEIDIALSDLDEDDYIDMMNDDIEENAKLYEEERGINLLKKKKKGKKEKKNENDIKLVEKEESDSDNEKNDNSDFESEEGDNSSDYYSKDNENENINNNKDIPIDEDDYEIDDINIKNPLRKQNKKNKKENKIDDIKEEINEENNLSSDTEEEIKQNKNQKKKKEKKEKIEKLNNERGNEDKKEKEEEDSSDDGYDTDEKAEIRAIAKKMLRKKTRLDILNKSYNRYAFEDDEKVPKWFLEEEKLHNVPQKPITKQEVLAEKEYLRKINVRIPKKVLEAKARKRNKLQKRLQKVRQKAEAISKQDEYTEISKVKQIEKLYKRELSKGKERKKYIISRANKNNVGKDSRFVKHVDRRLKKDKRALKVREKRKKRFRRKK